MEYESKDLTERLAAFTQRTCGRKVSVYGTVTRAQYKREPFKVMLTSVVYKQKCVALTFRTPADGSCLKAC